MDCVMCKQHTSLCRCKCEERTTHNSNQGIRLCGCNCDYLSVYTANDNDNGSDDELRPNSNEQSAVHMQTK